jgi:chromosome segregation ATPase
VLSRQLQSSERQKKDLEKEKNACQSELSVLREKQRGTAEAERQLQELNQDISKLKEEAAGEVQRERSRFEKETTSLNRIICELKREMEGAERAAKEKVRTVEEEAGRVRGEVERVESELKQANWEREFLKKERGKEAGKVKELEEESRVAREAVGEMKARMVEMKEEKAKEVRGIMADFDELKGIISRQNFELESQNNKIKELRNTVEMHSVDSMKKESEMKKLQEGNIALSLLEAELGKQRGSNQQLKSENDLLLIKVDGLETSLTIAKDKLARFNEEKNIRDSEMSLLNIETTKLKEAIKELSTPRVDEEKEEMKERLLETDRQLRGETEEKNFAKQQLENQRKQSEILLQSINDLDKQLLQANLNANILTSKIQELELQIVGFKQVKAEKEVVEQKYRDLNLKHTELELLERKHQMELEALKSDSLMFSKYYEQYKRSEEEVHQGKLEAQRLSLEMQRMKMIHEEEKATENLKREASEKDTINKYEISLMKIREELKEERKTGKSHVEEVEKTIEEMKASNTLQVLRGFELDGRARGQAEIDD